MRSSQGGHGSWNKNNNKIKVNARILFILARNMINDPMNRRVIMPLMIHNHHHHQYFFGRYFPELWWSISGSWNGVIYRFPMFTKKKYSLSFSLSLYGTSSIHTKATYLFELLSWWSIHFCLSVCPFVRLHVLSVISYAHFQNPLKLI